MAFDGEIRKPPAFHAAPGVTYAESSHAPGLKLFRCEAHACTLTAQNCAHRWTKAQDARGYLLEQLEKCRACTLGAQHAGKGALQFSSWYRSAICSRCGVGCTRMIGGRLCLSDYNRGRELRAGKNARGRPPIELMKRPLHAVRLMVEVEAPDEEGATAISAREILDPESSGVVETMIHCLRTTPGRIAFGWAGPGVQPRDAVVNADEPVETTPEPPPPDPEPNVPPAPDPLLEAMVRFMVGRAEWTGSYHGLLTALAAAVPEAACSDGWPPKSSGWPESGIGLSTKLRHRAVALAAAGICVAANVTRSGLKQIAVTNALAVQDGHGTEGHADRIGEPEPLPAAAAEPVDVLEVAAEPEPQGAEPAHAELAAVVPHDLEFFTCSRLRATMTTRGCSARWMKAQTADRKRWNGLAGCRRCATGAAHSAEAGRS